MKASVKGLSSLRAREEKPQVVTEEQKALQEYLKRKYTEGTGGGVAHEEQKRKKKKKKAAAPAYAGIRIIDEDASGFVPANRVVPLDVAEDEDGPVVANPQEAARAARQLEKERAGLSLSGWEEADASPGAGKRGGEREGGRVVADSDGDISPPRRGAPSPADPSPPQGQSRGKSASRGHKERREKQREASEDLSPPRREGAPLADLSPPRDRGREQNGRQHRGVSQDLSPPRRGGGSPADLSPPRGPAPGGAAGGQRGGAAADLSPPRRGESELERRKRKRVMSDGGIAGLVTGKELQAELKAKRNKEEARLAALDVGTSGRGAETVYRDKASGKRVTAEEVNAAKEAEKEKKKPEKPVWGGGLAQEKARAAAREELERLKAQPFARTADDEELNQQQREAIHFGDPMAHLARKRQAQRRGGKELPDVVLPEAVRKQKERTGRALIPQEVGPHSWLRRGVGPPPNRYNIRPGRHWDGVDRSNGFERDMFKQRSAQASARQEYKMWSQADL